MEINITHIDTACVLLEINGYKILTDPTLDGAGGTYYHGFGAFSSKTSSPAVAESELEDVDLIILSHHQHKDNFDIKGKAFAFKNGNIISTKAAAKEMDGVKGLDDWESFEVKTDRLKNLKITATPAQHRPWWIPEFVSGKVIGFIIEFDGQENGVIYISGDTVYFDGLVEVAKQFKIDVGIFHVGSVQFRYLTGLGMYTMDAKGLLKAAGLMKPRLVIPIHREGWTHFKEKESDLELIIKDDTHFRDKTLFLESGVKTRI
ncbi:MBL fold metallo-hydrolase [Pedobacter frigiditerrae]|uniref:MBL fold metallo-hydrolase n=1 Tax=Pedobacter frigiditerrae TaxID=2530452 RepID=A0A4R0MNW9_9SPHI|nr:MBL fold metallo-hydrolase [Pedobacter frigiditerrae]TCC88519.1 MBL fold metallo-hydrolase [Pedobacter frigiditerrae]